jgi:TfoX/Sxy family transcriptional regulator of competence genes
MLPMAYDEALAERVRDILVELGSHEERKMFGGICFMRHGRMCCGVLKDDLIVKLGPEAGREALTQPYVRPLDFTGRPMRGLVYVGPHATAGEASLRGWLIQAAEFGDTAPAKPARRARR